MSHHVFVPALLLFSALTTPLARADDSALVRLLKSGRVPEDRQPQVVSKIGQLGSAEDLRFLYDKALTDDGFAPAVRVKALETLAEAALTRKGLKPNESLASVTKLITQENPTPLRLAAIHLIGLWKQTEAIGLLSSLALDDKNAVAIRHAAFGALGMMGEPARSILDGTEIAKKPKAIQALACAALAKVDAHAAAPKAVSLIATAEKGQDFLPLIAAFLGRHDGAEILSKAIDAAELPVDNAKLALRACYALGRSDAPLIASLSKAAKIESEVKPPTKEEMDRLVADVSSKGDPGRGERIFRRAELNCMKCHSIAGAAGGVGPELSPIGLTSPVDYVINSILLPDQAIKEQYQTQVIATNDGQIVQGIVADKDESKIVLKQATGELITIPTSEIDESKEGGSLMPKGLANLLTRDEFLDLVRFISELGKPGPYVVHTIPTIQRWRIMKPVPEDLEKVTPDAGAFVAKIRDSDPSNWVAGYGLSTGEVPVSEFAQLVENRVLYLRGEIEVSSAGKLDVDVGSKHGVFVWLDDKGSSDSKQTWDVTPGKHTLTLRVDKNDPKLEPIVVKLAKSAGSSAEFTVVGGR